MFAYACQLRIIHTLEETTPSSNHKDIHIHALEYLTIITDNPLIKYSQLIPAFYTYEAYNFLFDPNLIKSSVD